MQPIQRKDYKLFTNNPKFLFYVYLSLPAVKKVLKKKVKSKTFAQSQTETETKPKLKNTTTTTMSKSKEEKKEKKISTK